MAARYSIRRGRSGARNWIVRDRPENTEYVYEEFQQACWAVQDLLDKPFVISIVGLVGVQKNFTEPKPLPGRVISTREYLLQKYGPDAPNVWGGVQATQSQVIPMDYAKARRRVKACSCWDIDCPYCQMQQYT